ncbi:Arf GTPase arf3 [Linnemannia exigua]|uniref:Arf GTPase arf3 n=1 Tax=Linnemannia exigua TaxID=604196 RepID=A0AAD4DMF8_9FUNG|nr:Arf GTPase arf3 [Linnemannia exigua]
MRMRPHNCQRDYKILMLGLDSSGKTTILYKLYSKPLVRLIPNTAFNIEALHTPQGEHLTIWDISGQSRVNWQFYVHGNIALVFVVDSTDYGRVSEAKEALWWIFEGHKEEMKGTLMVLVYANKQDQPNAMTVDEIKDELDVENLPRGRNGRHRRWHVQGASALMDVGLWEGVDWLCAQIKDTRNPRLQS